MNSFSFCSLVNSSLLQSWIITLLDRVFLFLSSLPSSTLNVLATPFRPYKASAENSVNKCIYRTFHHGKKKKKKHILLKYMWNVLQNRSYARPWNKSQEIQEDRNSIKHFDHNKSKTTNRLQEEVCLNTWRLNNKLLKKSMSQWGNQRWRQNKLIHMKIKTTFQNQWGAAKVVLKK